MNLRKVEENYDIGLDLGTGSVGWAVADEKGELLRFKGRPTWGSRLFPSADTAATTRIVRGQRRRYVRRRWRLDLLQGLFVQEMEGVDPNFFLRMNQSRLLKEDRDAGCCDYRYPFFNEADFTERDYYERFPTIYHLRHWLMTTEYKADIRLIYLAFHNIVKHRGNFLRQGQTISSRDAKMGEAIEGLCEAIESWASSVDALSESFDLDVESVVLKIAKEFDPKSSESRKDRSKRIAAVLGFPAAEKKRSEAIACGILGLSCDVKTLFGIEEIDKPKIYLSKDEDVDAFVELCPDEGAALFAAMRDVYAAYVLQGLLSLREGEGISANKIAEYERYGKDLALLKELVRIYVPEKYNSFFRGSLYAGSHKYDATKAEGYTRYNLGTSKLSYDAFAKEVKKLFASSEAASDVRYQDMMTRFEEATFLRRLKTSDNGSIYYQLHLEEMNAIIDNQKKFYPFLDEQCDKLTSLVEFRIPYYVGPLQVRNAAVNERTQEKRFAWAKRKPGMEDVVITPWNWDDVIDRHESAEAFIKRMTGNCTYLQGRPVLPKSSLLYEEFCVLNELNGARMSFDGDEYHRIESFEDRRGIINDLFRKGKVSYKKVEDWLCRNYGYAHVHVKGGQGESGFESRMGSYIFFSKDIFGTGEIPEDAIPMVEEIILWNTLFEDRDILKEKLREKYGDRLSDDQIKKICKKRFSGWGRLSKEFLLGIKVETDEGSRSIIQIMREGNPNNGQRSRPMVLMEILHDDDFGFETALEEANRKYNAERGGLTIEDLPGSPALRRSVNQAIRIVDEIAHIASKPPAHIYIEVARDEDARNKGKRTVRRENALKAAFDALKAENPEAWASYGKDMKAKLGTWSQRLNEERVMLYFAQCGRCMYSGNSIDINQLFDSSLYEVDHILPRTYIKDDSLENKALVLRSENQRKTDSLLLEPVIQRRQKDFWNTLLKAKLIGEKKYRNLMRSSVGEAAMKGFIARQLVETSQIVKFVQEMLREKYPDTKVQPIKAAVSSQLRDRCHFVKCREINDFHHAHDAFLACRVGQFVQLRHPGVFENPIALAHSMKKFIQQQGKEFRKTRKMPGSASYIVESFVRSAGFDPDTGEIDPNGILWDARKAEDSIRRSLNYKDCFISRMPEETTGAFWDATIYSPRDPKKKMALSLKEGLDPKKYGSFSREQFAYFFVYVARNLRNGKLSFVFASVPVRISLQIAQHEDALVEFAQKLAESEGLEFVRIAKRKVYKYQLIELNGDRLYITGKKEVRNGRQVALSQGEVGVIKMISEGEPTCEEDRIALLDSIARKMLSGSKKLSAQLGLCEITIPFKAASADVQERTLTALLSIASASTNMIDMSAVGGSKYAGCMGISFSNELANGNFFFVDQSVTGMFERRYRLEL